MLYLIEKRIGFCLEEGRDPRKAIIPFADMAFLVKLTGLLGPAVFPTNCVSKRVALPFFLPGKEVSRAEKRKSRAQVAIQFQFAILLVYGTQPTGRAKSMNGIEC